MPKFEIEFEITGLKLKVKGEREDISALTANLSQQLGGLLPSPDMTEPPDNHQGFMDARNVTPIDAPKPTKRKRAAKSSSNASTPGEVSVALDWRHSPEKWGMPTQAWNAAEKGMWLLYVVGKELESGELSSKQISETFNKHFKQAGAIRSQNISRDFGKRKLKSPAEVGQDTTKPGEPWFLTDAGNKIAESLIIAALGSENSKNGSN